MSDDLTKSPNAENWKRVKAWVDNNDELDINLAKEVEFINAGTHGSDKHTLQLYIYNFPDKYPHISATYSWARCPKCNETRWIKKAAYWNGLPGVCYDRYTKRISD